MFSDSRWWYTYVVSVFPDGDTAMQAPVLHMLSWCFALPSQIGQPAMISSSTKGRGSWEFSKTQGDFCWQCPLHITHTTTRVWLWLSQDWTIASPSWHSFISHVCVIWSLMDKVLVETQIDECIFGWGGVGSVWRCWSTHQKPFVL